MTNEMLALADDNERRAAIATIEIFKGEIEQIPLADNSVDIIISNCAINVAGSKDRVLCEHFAR